MWADVILPSAMWIEREGMYGNSERRTQYFKQMVDPPGQALSDTWQIVEVARRMGFKKLFPWDKKDHIEKIWNEYIQFHAGDKHGMAPYKLLQERPGVIWPLVKGKETKWRYNAKYDPACKRGGYDFYGKPDHKAWIIMRPYEPMPEAPDKEYPFLLNTGRILEHWHTGSMTRRIPVLHNSMNVAYAEFHPDDARKLGIKEWDWVRVTSRRGNFKIRAVFGQRGMPQRGDIFIPFFDENLMVNDLTLDAYCPISKQPDYKKCAVKVEKA